MRRLSNANGATRKVFDVNGVKVGVFALMGGSEFAGVRAPEGVEFEFQDPFQTAAEVVPGLQNEADIVVLLSQMQSGDTDRVVESVPGIDVALYGQRPTWQAMAEKTGATIVNRTGSRGQYMGQLVLIVDPEGSVTDWGSRNAALDDKIVEDEEVARLASEAEAKAKQMRLDARQQRQADFERRLSGERYLGAETCKRCHEAQYKQWSESPHAHAFAAHEHPPEGKALTPECVGCHVTGYGDPAGVRSDSRTLTERPTTKPDLADVQCEACHFRGSEHVRTGQVTISEATCRSCHTDAWSPDFDFEKALVAVRH